MYKFMLFIYWIVCVTSSIDRYQKDKGWSKTRMFLNIRTLTYHLFERKKNRFHSIYTLLTYTFIKFGTFCVTAFALPFAGAVL